MTDPTQSNQPREDHLNELIAEYLRRVDGGEELDPQQFIAPHPQVAESFRQYLRDAEFVDRLKQSRGAPDGGLAPSRDTANSKAAEETIPPGYVSGGQKEAAEARQFGRYRLVKLLGQGAMGTVYLAEDPELQRQVALKIPKFLEDEDAGSRGRFYREARAAATLNHPNICQVHDIGEQDGTPFITMAYVRGKPLSDFVSAKRQWPERDVAKLARKIAVALDEAHAQGIVHRDLKPSNIMLDQRHEPIVMDFGLAGWVSRPGEEKLTHARMLVGTPAYMSPEQAQADMTQVGPPSDVYSLGVICYELLVGEVPFRGPVGAVLGQIVRDEPRPPSELRPSLDKRLEAICLKMMAKAPEDRYGSAGEVAAALRQFLEATAPAVQSSQHAAAAAALELEARKQEIIRRLQAGQFGPAVDALDKLAGVEGPGAGEYAAWARSELARVRALPQELLEKGPAMVETAIELIASQEYAEAARILGAVPEEYRSAEAAKLLEKATKLQQEAEQLNARMHQAVHKQQYDGLQQELARLLELQPGNLTARELYDKLGTYAPGRPYRFDKEGKLLPAHRTPLLVLLGGVLRQALRGYAQRQKYRRDAAGRRLPAPGEPAPAARRSPILPVAVVLLVFALVALGIVVLLRDGRQTVRVQIDEAVLADESVTLHIDGNRMEIAGLGETIKLAPGEHGYELCRGDELVRSGEFIVLRGDNPALEISFDEGPLVDTAETPRPAEQPPLAAAPFNSTEAKQHQREWAAYLGIPVETSNSIGMKLILIPPGEFDMGSTQEEIDEFLSADENRGLGEVYTNTIRAEAPRHRVTITRPFYLGTYEVTQAEYQRVMGVNPSGLKASDGDAPVEQVSWSDALEFCRNLSDLSEEMAAGRQYRLPTDAEWEYACRAGTVTAWHCGDSNTTLQEYAWFNVNAGGTTHPVGRLKPNAWGLYDMHGNVWELCADWYSADYYAQSPPNDPSGPSEGSFRVHRGGTWQNPARDCRSAHRNCDPPDVQYPNLGFRVVCEIEAAPERRTALPTTLPETTVPAAANAPFDEAQAKAHQKAWADYLGVPVEKTNSIGMKLVLVPPGEFDMGSTQEEVDQLLEEARELGLDRYTWYTEHIPTEAPKHRVRITRASYLGKYEVTVGQFRKFVEATSYVTDVEKSEDGGRGVHGGGMAYRPEFHWKNPGFPQDEDHPASIISWNDAAAFCQWLSNQEGRQYRLPTEAEWEYACRAGTSTRFYSGDAIDTLGDAANLDDASCPLVRRAEVPWLVPWDDGYPFTAPVGRFRANALGLHDMHGNVCEWCQDWYDGDYYQMSPRQDPPGPESGTAKVHRSGNWFHFALCARAAYRRSFSPGEPHDLDGFRVVLIDAAFRAVEPDPLAKPR